MHSPHAMDSATDATTPPPAPADCLGCRVTGSLTLLGLSTFFLFERSKLPRHDRGQRRWLLLCSSAFALGGVWRATTGLFTPQATPAPITRVTRRSDVSETPPVR